MNYYEISKRLTIIAVLCALFICANAQENMVKIKGNFLDTTYNGAIISFNVLKEGAPLNGAVAFTKSYDAKIDNNLFSITLPAKDEWFDVIFTIKMNDKVVLLNSGNITETTYTLHRGENIGVLITKEKKMIFSGKGSNRLNCQQNIYDLQLIPEGVNFAISGLSNKNNYEKISLAQFSFIQKNLEMKLKILELYRDSLSTFIFNRIWFDTIGMTYYDVFYALSLNAQIAKNRIPENQLFLDSILKEMPQTSNSEEALISSFYASSIFLKEINILKYQATDGTSAKPRFLDIYQAIVKKYQGEMRDKLILIAFLDRANRNPEAISFIDKALDIMGENSSKVMLIEWKNNMVAGNPAYSFKLPDLHGRIVSLKSLQGKIVIADFWFKGCFGCTLIPKALEIVKQKYAMNENVIFLSINVDSQKKNWEDGVLSGKYTNPGSVDLSLFPQGINHPLLKHYNYFSFPQLLVIDKTGKTASANPPDPRADDGKGLIRLINSLLANK